jgi:hypothetical protein
VRYACSSRSATQGEPNCHGEAQGSRSASPLPYRAIENCLFMEKPACDDCDLLQKRRLLVREREQSVMTGGLVPIHSDNHAH